MIFEANATPPAWSDGARRVLALFIILFWVAQFGLVTAQRLAFVEEESLLSVLPRLGVSIIAMFLSFGIARLLAGSIGKRPRTRVMLAIGLVVAAAPLHGLASFLVFKLFFTVTSPPLEVLLSYVPAVMQWLTSYAAVTGMIYALVSHFEAQEREREISRLQRVAADAQLRALRYQLNPHFMFNTLNSVTALISAGRSSDAESMVENLADFLRAGLSLDALEDITLKRELELQWLYLAIEKVRFVDRLRVREEVSPDAARALVPSLVTQPLIENAIRHAVAATTEPVDLIISAQVVGTELQVAIRNTAPNATRPGKRGTGVGLINVEERLRARFGPDARFTAGLAADGMYEVRFAVPCIRAGEGL
ncbi:MAG: histidine kinase [Pseudomonadota bacterium]